MNRNHNYESRKIAICGRSGQGKSTYQRELIRSWPAQWKFVYDHKGEFQRYLPAKFVATNISEAEASLKQIRSVVFNPTVKLEAECRQRIIAEKIKGISPRHLAFQQFIIWAWMWIQRLPGNKLLSFDENGRLVPRSGAYVTHPLNEAMETGREWGLDVAIASQRPTHLCPDQRGQITHWALFQMPAGWTKPLIEDYEEDFSAVAKLSKGQFLAYDCDAGEFSNGQSTPDQRP